MTDWPITILDVATCLAKRSKDAGTKVGAVVVSSDWQILGTGYNGFPKGAPDELLPTSGPGKHLWTIHAEENAVLATLRTGYGAWGAAMCVSTHRPCARCLRLLFHVGITHALYGVDELSAVQLEEARQVERVLGMTVQKISR